MKVILSRKGFDGTYGKVASPIFSDGTMLSLPIPGGSKTRYRDLSFNGRDYWTILKSLGYPSEQGETCHLDPDIRDGIRINNPSEWKPAFGQTGKAQGYLHNSELNKGDIFLFFGWFKKEKPLSEDFYESNNLHAVYGYMQIGDVIIDQKTIKEEYPWHPHSDDGYGNNALYVPSKSLVIDGVDYGKGYGTLTYRKDRVLTQENCSRANWIPYEFLMPQHIIGCNRKNSSKRNTLYYQGQWQEIVFDADNNQGILEWVKQILTD